MCSGAVQIPLGHPERQGAGRIEGTGEKQGAVTEDEGQRPSIPFQGRIKKAPHSGSEDSFRQGLRSGRN